MLTLFRFIGTTYGIQAFRFLLSLIILKAITSDGKFALDLYNREMASLNVIMFFSTFHLGKVFITTSFEVVEVVSSKFIQKILFLFLVVTIVYIVFLTQGSILYKVFLIISAIVWQLVHLLQGIRSSQKEYKINNIANFFSILLLFLFWYLFSPDRLEMWMFFYIVGVLFIPLITDLIFTRNHTNSLTGLMVLKHLFNFRTVENKSLIQIPLLALFLTGFIYIYPSLLYLMVDKSVVLSGVSLGSGIYVLFRFYILLIGLLNSLVVSFIIPFRYDEKIRGKKLIILFWIVSYMLLITTNILLVYLYSGDLLVFSSSVISLILLNYSFVHYKCLKGEFKYLWFLILDFLLLYKFILFY